MACVSTLILATPLRGASKRGLRCVLHPAAPSGAGVHNQNTSRTKTLGVITKTRLEPRTKKVYAPFMYD